MGYRAGAGAGARLWAIGLGLGLGLGLGWAYGALLSRVRPRRTSSITVWHLLLP